MFFEPQPTPYDLRWRMFGIGVRVHPWFWLVAVILGWSFTEEENGFLFLALWVVCVFVSILLHELGHVFVGRIFGSDGHIVLYSFGGLAIGSNNLRNRWQRIAVCFGGPLIQLVLFGLIKWFEWQDGMHWIRPGMPQIIAQQVLIQLKWINFFWPVLNLLPIWPLDGGQICREFFNWLMPGKGVPASLAISLTTSGFLAIHAFAASNGHPIPPEINTGGLYTAILFAMLALSNFQELQNLKRIRPWHEDYGPWER